MPRPNPPRTKKEMLKDMDEIIAVEKDYLDNPDPDLDSTELEEVEEDLETRFREERERGGIRQAELDYEGE